MDAVFNDPVDERPAWLLMAVAEGDRQHGGNDGYDDEPDAHYSWDSSVGNHARVAPGDLVVLWDKHRVLGASVIENIEVSFAEKMLHRCVKCGLAGIKARREMTPRYKCYKCKAEFDTPDSHVKSVVTYRSSHAAGWVDLGGVLSAVEVRNLCESPKSQLSLRPLRRSDFLREVRNSPADVDLDPLLRRAGTDVSGHSLVTVRVRVGQASFRDGLFDRYGPVCAVTGPAPEDVLDAGHLYSYAEIGVHHGHGGLLFRADIHRLFDRGLLGIDPSTELVRTSPKLESWGSYRALNSKSVEVPLSKAQLEWLKLHWDQHAQSLDPDVG